jgi:prepilin-type N-terminal cleavage/methylation domain-containing protein
MSARRRPLRRQRADQAGVSLVEVLCAITVFAIIAAGTAALTTQSMRHTIANRHASSAALLAQWKLEELRGRDFENIVGESESSSMAGQDYTVTTTVSDDDPAPNMKRLVITVDWTGPEGTREHEIETIFTSLRS